MPAVDASVLREAMARRLYRGSHVTGNITLPAVPGMLDEYVRMCATLFGAVGRPFSDDQLEHVKDALKGQLAEAVSASPQSTIVISYNAPRGTGLKYHIKAQWPIIAGAYQKATASREPRQSGSEPDAQVMSRADEDEMARRLYSGSVVTGQITIPAVPGMLDEYVRMCATLFGAVGRPFSKDQLEYLEDALKAQLAEAFSASPRSMIVISYNAPSGKSLTYQIGVHTPSVAEVYEQWTASREPPLFGSEPDARVMALANDAEDPSSYPILDIGAGTGRNALALARLGHPVDAVEITPTFATEIRTEAERNSLNVRVVDRDVFTTIDDLRRDYRLILLSEVVCDFRTTEQLRGLFELATNCLAPGGLLLFNVFVAHRDYVPDDAARQLGQQSYTGFSRRTNSPMRPRRCRSSSSPTSRHTSTRRPTSLPTPGHRRVGTSGGRAVSTSSIFRERVAQSSCAGLSIAARGRREARFRTTRPRTRAANVACELQVRRTSRDAVRKTRERR